MSMNGPPKPLLEGKDPKAPATISETKPLTAEEARRNLEGGLRGLAIELSAKPEGFPFPGIDEKAYATLKEDEEFLADTGVTPIDELIARFKAQGLKVVLSDDPRSPAVLIVPKNSPTRFLKEDSIFPRHLKLTWDAGVDPKLGALISLDIALKNRR